MTRREIRLDDGSDRDESRSTSGISMTAERVISAADRSITRAILCEIHLSERTQLHEQKISHVCTDRQAASLLAGISLVPTDKRHLSIHRADMDRLTSGIPVLNDPV